MAEVFVARQPIFDRRLEVVGYELLFRDGRVPEAAVASAEGATASVVLNSLTEIGLERIVGNRTAWINVSREFVLGGLAETVPPGLVCLELLEDQLLDEQLYAGIEELGRAGYRLALDDFQFSESIEPLLGVADVVKLDILALGRERFLSHARRLKSYGLVVLAEKVETHEDYAYCADAGSELFQGYFFCKPELVSGRKIAASRASLLQLIAALQDPGVSLSQLEVLIGRDISLSLRLLRYINSAFFGLRGTVRSVGQALALLGLENLRRWATLSAFVGVEHKPSELTLTALIRARFCQLATDRLGAVNSAELFTLGLFSVIDALMDAPMETVLASIPFPDDMRQALIVRQGSKGRLLDCVSAIEAGEFDRAQAIIRGSGDLYLEALKWATEAADSLFNELSPEAA